MQRSLVFSIALGLILGLLFAAEASAESEAKRLVVERIPAAQAASTQKFTIRINRPKPPRGASLDRSIEIRGCWLAENLKSVRALDKNKRKVSFRRSKDGSRLELKRLRGVAFPISAVIQLNTEGGRVQRGSTVTVRGQTKCQTARRPNGTTRTDCSAVQPVAVVGRFSGVTCQGPSDIEERASSAEVVLADGDAFSIRKQFSPLRFALTEGNFLGDFSDATVIVNGSVFMAPELQLVDGLLTVNGVLADGLNQVSVRALDQQGLQAHGDFSFWAGSNTLTVLLRDESGQALQDGEVTLRLADDPQFFVTKALSAGQAVFSDLPGTTIALSAKASGGRAGFSAGAGTDSTITITVLPLLEESAVANNDISSGLAGWVIPPGTNVAVVPHEEGGAETLPARGNALAAEGPDQDLRLSTSGQGPRFMTRTFRTDPRTRLVRIRYRFQTSEFPGGYFGSRFNDFYNVSLRSSKGTQIIDDGSSMNALGRAAFSPSGQTVWKSTVIPVNRGQGNPSEGEVVQANVAVANVADGAYDSQVIVDKIEESSFAITQAELFDIDNRPIRFLSADTHPYFDGFTWIHGTITLEGQKDDKVTSLYLQLMNGSQEVAAAELSSQAAAKILNKKFGKSGKLRIQTPMLLFKVFPNVLSTLGQQTDRGFSLVIQATNDKGQKAHTSVGNVQQIVRFTGTARYDGRDEILGGDDWLLPSVRQLINNMPGVTWGDFSNMNAGDFPPHELHQTGRSADGWIPGYNSLNAQTAESLIALLNTSSGLRIRTLYVRYNRRPGNPFFEAIAGRTLSNGRRVDHVIVPDGSHGTHFHAEF